MECGECGSRSQVEDTLDEEQYRIEFCPFCGCNEIEIEDIIWGLVEE